MKQYYNNINIHLFNLFCTIYTTTTLVYTTMKQYYNYINIHLFTPFFTIYTTTTLVYTTMKQNPRWIYNSIFYIELYLYNRKQNQKIKIHTSYQITTTKTIIL